MILLSHPTGNANLREAARALSEAGLLAELWTSVSWNRQHPLNKVLPGWVTRELNRRTFENVRQDHIHCNPWRETGRLLSRPLGLSSLARHEKGPFCTDAVYRSLDAKVAARLQQSADNIDGVYAYEDGALATFRTARRLGLKTIYELPIGYWKSYRELIEEEAALQPDWAVTLQGRQDSEAKLRRKEEELSLATDIIVPSEFVRSTLRKAGLFAGHVTVLPYGAPLGELGVSRERRETEGQLKVIFVGALSQRKGLSYLLRAVARLGSRVQLTLIGQRVSECPGLDAALRMHHWIPSASHAAVLDEISRQDVMVFPSLFEGFGLVVLEAMSRGVPVITTQNTGAPHFITDGEDGFIVPIRDVDAIVERLEVLILDRHRLIAMSQAAIVKASENSWEQYRRRLATIVRQALESDRITRSTKPSSSHPEVCWSC